MSASLVMVINPTIQYAMYEYLVRVRAGVQRRRQRRRHGKAAGRPPAELGAGLPELCWLRSELGRMGIVHSAALLA